MSRRSRLIAQVLHYNYYIVMESEDPWAKIRSRHTTFPEAYRSFVRVHRARYKNHRFPMAQTVRAVIATAAPDDQIRTDIYSWANADGLGPQSKRRLPLPIVVHQWQPKLECWIRFGVGS